MILTKNDILNEIKQKRIKITPFDKNSIGPGSIDLKLGNELRLFHDGTIVNLDENADYKKHAKKIKFKEYVLKPGEFVLGITKEKITLPSNICGWLNSRSRFARFGFAVHVTASFVQPGVSNKQVLEIYNFSPMSLKLKPNQKLCQITLERCETGYKYKGKHKNQVL